MCQVNDCPILLYFCTVIYTIELNANIVESNTEIVGVWNNSMFRFTTTVFQLRSIFYNHVSNADSQYNNKEL